MGRFLAFSLILASGHCLGGAVDNSKEVAMETRSLIFAQRVSIQVGFTTLSPDEYSMARLLAEVDRYNSSIRMPDLADNLNVDLLSIDKVRAFIEGLSRLDGESLALIAGQTLRLNFPALRLHAFSPVTLAQLQSSYSLKHDPINANPHLASVRLEAPISIGLARRVMEAAQHAVAVRDRELAELDQTRGTHEDLVRLSRIRHERASAAKVWLALAQDLAADASAPADAVESIRAARAALARHSVAPRSGGMPP